MQGRLEWQTGGPLAYHGPRVFKRGAAFQRKERVLRGESEQNPVENIPSHSE